MGAIPVSWSSALRLLLALLLPAAITIACITLPIEKILKDFLIWTNQNLGPWGPLVLAFSYIPLTVFAVPASVLTAREAFLTCFSSGVLVFVLQQMITCIFSSLFASTVLPHKLGGGYLFGLPIGFVADSLGATIGATAAFLLGKTIGRPLVISKLKDCQKFQAIDTAIQRSGFKIVLLLRLAPLLPFNMLNYLLSVTPVSTGEYIMASWLGMMPVTLALVYVGTTMKDLSDTTHGWSQISTVRWVILASGIVLSVALMVCVTKVAKSSLEKALMENGVAVNGVEPSSQLPVSVNPSEDLYQSLLIKIDPSIDGHGK